VPVLDKQGQIFGHVAIIDDKPMPEGQRAIDVMRIFAARVSAEVERLRMETALTEANQRLTRSEEQFRDLFEEAPIAYVHEGLDSRFIRANRTALRVLGVKPEEVPGLFGSAGRSAPLERGLGLDRTRHRHQWSCTRAAAQG